MSGQNHQKCHTHIKPVAITTYAHRFYILLSDCVYYGNKRWLSAMYCLIWLLSVALQTEIPDPTMAYYSKWTPNLHDEGTTFNRSPHIACPLGSLHWWLSWVISVAWTWLLISLFNNLLTRCLCSGFVDTNTRWTKVSLLIANTRWNLQICKYWDS